MILSMSRLFSSLIDEKKSEQETNKNDSKKAISRLSIILYALIMY